jgi:hypothetical protein
MGVEEVLALVSLICIGTYLLLYLVDKIQEFRLYPKQMPKIGERYISKEHTDEKHHIVVEDVVGSQIKFSFKSGMISILHVTYFLECYELYKEPPKQCCGCHT